MRARLVWAAILVIAFVLVMFCSASAQVPQSPSFTLSSQTVNQGGVLVVTLSPYSRMSRVVVELFGYNFEPNENGVIYVGIDPDTKPGKHEACLLEGTTRWHCSLVEVLDHDFAEVVFNRNRVLVAIPQRNLETKQIGSAYLRGNRYRSHIKGNSSMPIDGLTLPGDITGEFYSKRTYLNGVSIHRGVDLRASVGTPVKAINSGVVVLTARNFSLEGNMVILDHGSNVFSLYLHLSKIDVIEGRMVQVGEKIGLSGATGMGITGPHLHLAMRVHGVSVDPMEFIETVK